jgi:uncharacterized SAM-binding protein YcdF (DUF218 family)
VRRLLVFFLVAFLALIGWAVVDVLNPPVATVLTGDAVIVHEGGHGERLAAAQALMDFKAAPVLVIMGGGGDVNTPANPMCGQIEPNEVICPTAEPATTVGEAKVLGELAGDRNWLSVVVVTSDYQLRRAAMLDRECTTAEVRGAAAIPDIGGFRRALLVSREVLALPQALLFGC